jgi:hypothetical protein
MVPKATLVPRAESNPNDETAASLSDFVAEILKELDQPTNQKAAKNR